MNLENRKHVIEKTLNQITEEPLEEVLRKHILPLNMPSEIENNFYNDILLELKGYGPIAQLFEDPEISEILVDGPEEIFIERNGVIENSNLTFANQITFSRFVKTLLSEMDKIADQRHPLVDGTLKNGARVHIALPPVTTVASIAIRKHQKSKWTLNKLVENQSLTSEMAQKLKDSLSLRKNILICGPTGAGKTTLLRALINEVKEEERIIIVEDTKELMFERKNAISLLARPSLEDLFPAITLTDLLHNALRMRPDRIVVGEIRSHEALVFLDALSTGHSGSMSSIHGSTASQALGRLETLASRAAPHWPLEAVRKLVYDGIDLIICIDRKNASRQVHEIADLAGLEDFGYLLNVWP